MRKPISREAELRRKLRLAYRAMLAVYGYIIAEAQTDDDPTVNVELTKACHQFIDAVDILREEFYGRPKK
jgi:hypothetical protein